MIKTENLTILFVDIAGFTATTSRQSRVENARLLQTFGSTLLPLIKSYKGKLIKTIGDALLITFRSPTDAMLCSMALQDAMHAHNLSAPDGEKIHIRVAANLGEVRVTKNDIFGEPVNVASRIEGVAPADEIYLSEAVYMAMNKAEVPAKEVGTRELAGISQPVRMYNIPRFSTHRLVAENANADEKGSELLYPYGGMHCRVRPRNLTHLLHLQGRKRAIRLLIPAVAVCVIALGAALGYQFYQKAASKPAVISQPEKEGIPLTGTEEMQQQVITGEQVSATPEVHDAAVVDTAGTAPKDVPEREGQKLAALPDKTSKSTGSTLSPETEEVKKESTRSRWSPEAEDVKQTSTWTPETDSVKKEVTGSTWTPETEKVKEEDAGSTWTPEPEGVKEVDSGSTSAQETDTVKKDLADWDVIKAKQALRAEEISRVEYNKIVNALKIQYDRKIRRLRQQLDSGEITRSEYDEEIRKAKLEYNGR